MNNFIFRFVDSKENGDLKFIFLDFFKTIWKMAIFFSV